MKRCSNCGEEKALDDFHRRSNAKDGRQSVCKLCNNEQRKTYYKTAHGRDNNLVSAKRYQVQNKRRLFDYLLAHPCIDCGERNPVVLQFDHKDNVTKSFCIGASSVQNRAWYKIEEEIKKCVVRCANCHTLRTAEQFNWYKLRWWNEMPA